MVLTDVTTDVVINKEETLGPVAPLYRFKSEDEAFKTANEAPTLILPRPRRAVRGKYRINFAVKSIADDPQ